MSDIVAVWEVPLSDKVHIIEFEHGTTTGKRLVRIDGEEIIRREWMFKLVGSEPFEILEGQAKCEILINASSGFSYDYTLLVDGKQLTKFKEIRGKVMKTWLLQVNGQTYRIVLEKDSLDIWVNGKKIESNNEFDEDGTAISFGLNDSEDACIKTISSGNKKEGIIYSLIVNGSEVPESLE